MTNRKCLAGHSRRQKCWTLHFFYFNWRDTTNKKAYALPDITMALQLRRCSFLNGVTGLYLQLRWRTF